MCLERNHIVFSKGGMNRGTAPDEALRLPGARLWIYSVTAIIQVINQSSITV